jgi:hypothetical protein
MYTPSYHTTHIRARHADGRSVDSRKECSEVVSLRGSTSASSVEDLDQLLERRIIDAIMQYVSYAADQVTGDDICRRCDKPMHRGTTSTGEPYYGCRTCKTLFLIKPAVLSRIFGYHSRVHAITELMAVEGLSYEAAACTLEVGFPEGVHARRQNHEAYLRYNSSNDEA